MSVAYRIEPLAKAHDRAVFACGVSQLDDWFHERAGQAARRGIATVHVLAEAATNAVLGFYTLSNFTIVAADLPAQTGRSLPDRIPLPAHLIGQLAVAARQQGKGYGGILLLDALRRAYRTTAHSASIAVVVHAIDATAAAWYARYGFVPFPAHPLHLLMPMKDIARLPPITPT